MKNETAISNEEIIAALLNSGTIKAAAASVGLSERAMYDRMSDHEFKGQYLEAKADILRAAVCNINESLNGAIETIAEIMNNEKNNPAIRLQAAQTLLNNAAKFSRRLTEAEALIDNHNSYNGIFEALKKKHGEDQ